MKLFFRTVMGMLVAASVASADVTFQDFTANFPDVGELPPLITSFENGRVFNANISIAPADGGSNVTVIVTNDDASAVSVPFDNYFVEGLTPYDGRISFGARTGGASGSHDIDNISLRINGSQVQTEGFDSVNEDWIDTNFADPSFFPYDTDDGFLRLTEEGINSTLSSVALPAAHAGAYDLLEVSFDFRVSQGAGGGADGVSFAYVPVADFGDEGFVPPYSEEPNLVGSLGVGFDTFNNTDLGDGGENSVSLHWDATTLSSVSIDTGLLEIDPPAVVGGTPFTQSTFGPAAGLGLRSDNGGTGVQQGYARLADEAFGNGSFLAFDKTSDSTESITAEFSFRISDVDGTRADGMAFVL
ncbi:MAG: hypothetical protein KDA87_23325, partial [Planctomycetales bacterium]|nr:hypothetical protein [Planctomycetales bacterium]